MKRLTGIIPAFLAGLLPVLPLRAFVPCHDLSAAQPTNTTFGVQGPALGVRRSFDPAGRLSTVTASASHPAAPFSLAGRVYASLADVGLRRAVRDRLYLLAEASPDAETCGTALMALASLHGHSEIDSTRVAGRAMKAATDSSNPKGLRFTALQAAADLGHADATPTAREWLACEKSVNLKAVAIGVRKARRRRRPRPDRPVPDPPRPAPRRRGARRAQTVNRAIDKFDST